MFFDLGVKPTLKKCFKGMDIVAKSSVKTPPNNLKKNCQATILGDAEQTLILRQGCEVKSRKQIFGGQTSDYILIDRMDTDSTQALKILVCNENFSISNYDLLIKKVIKTYILEGAKSTAHVITTSRLMDNTISERTCIPFYCNQHILH